MASSMLSDSAGYAVFVMCIVTAPICTLAAILRFVATRSTGRKQNSEDWCAYGAVAIHIIYISLSLNSLVFINGRNLLTLPPNELLYIGKATYATAPLFALNQLLSKASLLLFYYRIFGVHRGFAYWIYVITGFTVAWFIAVLYLYLFACRPVSRGWNLMEPGTCLDNPSMVAGAESINSALDFAMVILALWITQKLKISTSNKLKLGLLFTIGGFAGIVGIIKITQTYAFKGLINYMTALWTIVQMACSIICCCSPVLKPILPKTEMLKRLLSNISGSVLSLKPGGSQSYPQDQSMSASLDKGGRPLSVSFRPMPSSQNWLKLEEDSQAPRTTAWVERDESMNQSRNGYGDPAAFQMNAINVHRTVEVV